MSYLTNSTVLHVVITLRRSNEPAVAKERVRRQSSSFIDMDRNLIWLGISRDLLVHGHFWDGLVNKRPGGGSEK